MNNRYHQPQKRERESSDGDPVEGVCIFVVFSKRLQHKQNRKQSTGTMWFFFFFKNPFIITIYLLCCSEVDNHPESSKVGGVVAETPQETIWSVSFRAAIGAPVIDLIIPENTGKLVQRRPVNHLKRQNTVTCGCHTWPDLFWFFYLPVAINMCGIHLT